MLKKIVLVFVALALAKAQLPNLGFCPDYVPKADFNMDKFLGIWHEMERYFQLSDIVSRCLTSNYTRGPDGKVRVSSEVTNRITGVKRVLEGEIKVPVTKTEQGKLTVKYTSVPLTPETHYSVLETDYKNYAVLWSCTGLGLVHAQSAWVMTRSRVVSPEVLQQAHGVLDKYGLWKPYIVKSDQADCTYEAPAPAEQPTVATAPAVAEAAVSAEEPEEQAVKKSAENIYLRSASVLPEADVIDQTRKEEAPAQLPAAVLPKDDAIDESRKEEISAQLLDVPTKAAEEPVKELPATNAEPAKEVLPAEEKPALSENKPEDEQLKAIAPEAIPEVILKTAESVKKASAAEESLLSASPVAEESKTVEIAVPAESKPEIIEAVLLPEPDEETPKIVKTAESIEDSNPETAPIEKPIESAEQPKDVESVAEVIVPEIVEITKSAEEVEKVELAPVELPESVAAQTNERIAPIEATEEIEIVEIPAALPESAPVDSTLVETPAVPEAEEPKLVTPESADRPNIPEGDDEQLVKEEVAPAVPETPVADAQPLETVPVEEEPRLEIIN